MHSFLLPFFFLLAGTDQRWNLLCTIRYLVTWTFHHRSGTESTRTSTSWQPQPVYLWTTGLHCSSTHAESWPWTIPWMPWFYRKMVSSRSPLYIVQLYSSLVLLVWSKMQTSDLASSPCYSILSSRTGLIQQMTSHFGSNKYGIGHRF
jgi:hypothetical protein